MSVGPVDAPSIKRDQEFAVSGGVMGSAVPPIWVEILDRLCRERGARLQVEPDYGYAGFIERPDGQRHFFKGTSFDINGAGAAGLARDKDYASRFLAMAGLPVPESVLVHAPRRIAAMVLKNSAIADRLSGADAAQHFAERVGFPLYVKPNEGSEGEGVTKVGDGRTLDAALETLFALNDRVLVQRAVPGEDLRLVVLAGRVLAAFRRTPFQVVGDGRRSVRELGTAAIAAFTERGKGGRISLDDPRIATHLDANGLTLDYVPPVGRSVRLIANANLSTGGSAEEITATVAERVRNMAVAAAKAVGLRFAGVDLLVADPEAEAGSAYVLEVNAGPGLSYFHRLGPAQAETVERIYRALLDAILR